LQNAANSIEIEFTPARPFNQTIKTVFNTDDPPPTLQSCRPYDTPNNRIQSRAIAAAG
jgi:hypothetical protein